MKNIKGGKTTPIVWESNLDGILQANQAKETISKRENPAKICF
jgi:hypothetical protein